MESNRRRRSPESAAICAWNKDAGSATLSRNRRSVRMGCNDSNPLRLKWIHFWLDGSGNQWTLSYWLGWESSSRNIMNFAITKLAKSFSSLQVLDDITFSFSESSIIAILGPSGCGKTTILNIISAFFRIADVEGFEDKHYSYFSKSPFFPGRAESNIKFALSSYLERERIQLESQKNQSISIRVWLIVI